MSAKISCRACGATLVAVKKCPHCGEPVAWECPGCFAIYDSTHVHKVVQDARPAGVC